MLVAVCIHIRALLLFQSFICKQKISSFPGTKAAASCRVRSCNLRYQAASAEQADHSLQKYCCKASQSRGYRWGLHPVQWQPQWNPLFFLFKQPGSWITLQQSNPASDLNSRTDSHIFTANDPFTASKPYSGNSLVKIYRSRKMKAYGLCNTILLSQPSHYVVCSPSVLGPAATQRAMETMTLKSCPKGRWRKQAGDFLREIFT